MKKTILTTWLLTAMTLSAQAQVIGDDIPEPLDGPGSVLYPTAVKFRIYLKDKQGTRYDLKHPEKFLSKRSLERRKRQGIEVDETDLPVSQVYLDKLSAAGVKVLETSKWNNTVVVQTLDWDIIENIKKMDFVTGVRKVATYYGHSPEVSSREKRLKLLDDAEPTPSANLYGQAEVQINQLNGHALHDQGFKGDGIVVAVTDAGFFNVDIIPVMQTVKILGTKDFVDPDSPRLFGASTHGLNVLSCMGANSPYIQIGTAPEASYWLLRSEDEHSEQPVEEDNWVAAVEFADSVGADVVNSSLGYHDYDDDDDDFPYTELDGKTHINSITASMMASKGMILCNSAGNEGDGTWKKIGTPADASDILAVGAVDSLGVNTDFSSVGYSADGRVKPDVMAMGAYSRVVYPSGKVFYSFGTSFSSPIMAGMVASLWSALPHLNAYQIMDIVRRSGNNADHPDNVFGYGIPDFGKALELGRQM